MSFADGGGSPAPPAAILGAPRIRLDVREDIRSNREPFARIMQAVNGLGPGEVLVLQAPFEPRPLYAVLGKRGLAHWVERGAADDWCVWFYRGAAAAAGGGLPRPGSASGAADEPPGAILDVRGLEPPLPMLRVLEALDRLAPGQLLEVLHERRPLFLYPQIDERRFTHETTEPEPGLVRIVIQRRAGP